MISLVIYGVIAISLASAAGYAYLTFTNTTKQATYVQENTVRLNSAVTAVQASLLPLSPGATGGILLAPAGVTATDSNHVTYTQLPPSVGAVGLSPWNQPYLYCPISQTQASDLASNALNTVASATVQSPSGATYTVGTYTGPATAGVSYVISNTTANAVANATGYVAFVVSSTGPGQTVPDCSQIAVSGNSVTVPNGVVRGVKASLPFKQRLAGASDRMELYVSTQTTGDGTGHDSNNLAVLDYAINLWLTLQPRQTDIYLTGGQVYAITSNLNAENPGSSGTPVYPFAQAQGTNLVIETLPGTAAATVNLPNALVLTTSTSFVNLTLNAASTLNTTAPLLLKNVTYNATNSGAIFSIVGTSLSSQNTSFVNTTLNAINSSVEFYNYASVGTAATYVNTQLAGAMSQFGFDGQSASTFTFSANGTANSPISMSGSSVNIGSNATVSITNATDSVVLSNSTMNVQHELDLYGGAAFGALDAFDGSTVSVPAGGTLLAAQTNGAMPYAIFVRGSKVAIDGTLSTTGLNAGVIGIKGDGELTGTSGTLIDAQPTRYPCVYLTNVANGSPVPIWLNAAGNYPTFAEVQKGYQPMVGDIANAAIASTNGIDTNAYNYLSLSRVPVNDPLVYNTTGPTNLASSNSLAGYVDPPTLERGVRDLVNLEWVTGLRLNFYGTCVQ